MVHPQRVHRAAGLGQAVGGHPLGGDQGLDRPVDVPLVGQHRPSRLDLDAERAEGVRQDVVDLAGDAGPLAEHVGPPLLGLQPLVLRQQGRGLFGLDPVGTPLEAEHRAHRDQQRIPGHRAETAPGDPSGHPDRDNAGRGDRDASPQVGFATRPESRDAGEGDQGLAAAAGHRGHAAGDGHRSERHRQAQARYRGDTSATITPAGPGRPPRSRRSVPACCAAECGGLISARMPITANALTRSSQ